MPRQARLYVAGALHHIMVRGINKQNPLRVAIACRSSKELGLSGAEIARHLGVNTSSINRAIACAEDTAAE